VLAANGDVRDAAEPVFQAFRLVGELAQRVVLDLVLAAHLLHEQLGVGDDLDVAEAKLDRLLEAGQERAILRHVVRGNADRLAARVEDRAVFRLQHVAVRRRPRVPAGAPVSG